MKYWFTHLHRAVVRKFFFLHIEIYGTFERPCQDFRIHYSSSVQWKNGPQKIVTTLTLERWQPTSVTNYEDRLLFKTSPPPWRQNDVQFSPLFCIFLYFLLSKEICSTLQVCNRIMHGSFMIDVSIHVLHGKD